MIMGTLKHYHSKRSLGNLSCSNELVLAVTPFRSKVVETLKSIVFGYEQSVFYGVKLCSFTMIIIVAGHVNFGLHEVLTLVLSPT